LIPQMYINAWRSQAPWPDDAQIEQDLILSRTLVELFSDQYLAEKLVFRGGTAIQKLFLNPPMRYSEDIDLVQGTSEPIGEAMTRLRKKLDPWLGKPKYKQSEGRVTFTYRFESEIPPTRFMKVKVEINTREHFSILGLEKRYFRVNNPWFMGECDINIYRIEELLGTKLRALYQRKKGRDLFDLASVNKAIPSINWDKVVECFHKYMAIEGHSVSRSEFEENIHHKVQSSIFKDDMQALISLENTYDYDLEKGSNFLKKIIYPRLKGNPWKEVSKTPI